MIYIFSVLSIDTNNGHICGHIELGHNGQKTKMAKMAIRAQLDMATNMPIIGVYGKNRKNVDHPRKRNWKKCIR